MPVKIGKISGSRYRVSTPHGVKAKSTTRAKAQAQARLLKGIEHGWTPIGKNDTTKSGGLIKETHTHRDVTIGAGPRHQGNII